MSTPAVRVLFGEFVFDADARRLTRARQAVHLSPKALQLLQMLLARRPRAASKAEIHEALWPATYVTDASLARVATEIRSALDDDARQPRFVRTVYGFGYAFSGEAAQAPPSRAGRDVGACRLTWGKREIVLGEGENILGRIEGAAVWIDSRKVSRLHARIVVAHGRATLEDLGSKNGTLLRGQRLAALTELADGDAIRVGPVELTYRSARAAGSTETDVAD